VHPTGGLRFLRVAASSNKGINRRAKQRRSARCSVPVALRAPAPGQPGRSASCGSSSSNTRAGYASLGVPDPSLQKWRKALSFSAGHAMREPHESSERDSPAAAEISTEKDSLPSGASLMADTDTRGKSSTCGGTPSWFARLIQASWYAKGVRGGSAGRLPSIEV